MALSGNLILWLKIGLFNILNKKLLAGSFFGLLLTYLYA